MRNLKKPYQMYVLNLDASRIFWLTTFLLLLLCFSFFIGLLIGKENGKGAVNEITTKNKAMIDEIINKLDDKNNNDDEYQFYELISPEKITEKNRKDKIIPKREYIKKESPPADKNNYNTSLDTGKEVQIKNNRKSPPAEDTENIKLSKKNPYTVQVASYTKYKNAEKLKIYLISKKYPAYIIKSNVKGINYYRVRIGPFASKSVCLKVIEIIRHKKECRNSFITAFK